MKPLFTFVFAFVCNTLLLAQIDEDFEPITNTSPITSLTASCWQFSNINWSNGSILNNTSSIYIGPITNGRESGNLSTPFLTNTGGSVTVSFLYCVRNKLNNTATRTIQLGYTNNQGVFNQLDIIVINSNTPAGTQSYSQTFTNVPAGAYRFTFFLSGSADGNTNLYFDKLNINLPKYYSAGCNRAPVAENDNFTSTLVATLTGNILNNDSDPDGESITATILQQPSTGLLTLNTDGSFRFLPSLNFTGGPVSFTYLVTDKGYTPLTSNVATVTMNYPSNVTLPIRLLEFQATLSDNKSHLKWQVEENESGNSFEVQKSVDGYNFKTVGLIFTHDKAGRVTYTFTEVEALQRLSYYKLKINDKDNQITYSKVVSLDRPAHVQRPAYVYRHPTLSQSLLHYQAPKNSTLIVTMYDQRGAIIRSWKEPVNMGANAIRLPLQVVQELVWIEILNGSQRFILKTSNH